MNILLLGGAGFIGVATANALHRAGHTVVVADSFDPQIHGADFRQSPTFRRLAPGIGWHTADVRDAAATGALLAQAEAVYFFAAGTGTGQSMYQVRRYCDVNVMGAAVFAELLAQHRDRVRRVVFSSTRAVYGEGAYACPAHGRVFPASRGMQALRAGVWEPVCPRCGGPAGPLASGEDDPAGPVSIYGLTKYAQEQLLVQTCRSLAIPLVAFRYQNVYGPGQSLTNPYTGILGLFTQVLAAGGEVNVFEDGRATRDFVHVDDVVHFNLRALECAAEEPLVLNVGSARRVTLVQIVEALAAALGVGPRLRVSGDFRAGDIRHAAADLAQLTARLGRHEFIGFEAGVRELVAWIRGQGAGPLAAGAYENSLDEMRRAGLLGGRT